MVQWSSSLDCIWIRCILGRRFYSTWTKYVCFLGSEKWFLFFVFYPWKRFLILLYCFSKAAPKGISKQTRLPSQEEITSWQSNWKKFLSQGETLEQQLIKFAYSITKKMANESRGVLNIGEFTILVPEYQSFSFDEN